MDVLGPGEIPHCELSGDLPQVLPNQAHLGIVLRILCNNLLYPAISHFREEVCCRLQLERHDLCATVRDFGLTGGFGCQRG